MPGTTTARCLWCGTSGLPGLSCRRCRVTIGEAVDAAPLTTACPRCRQPLGALAVAADVTVHACTACRGIFVPAYAWSRIAGEPALGDAINAFLAPKMTGAALMPMLRCPACTTEMERGPFAVTSNIIVDVCTQNHGLWLDAGELPAALTFIEVGASLAPPRPSFSPQSYAQPGSFVPSTMLYGDQQPSHIRGQIDLEVAKIRADSSQRMAKAKQAAVLLAVIVIALRVGLGVMRARSRQNARPQTIEVPVNRRTP